METVKSRSESPFSRSKTKSNASDAPEIGNTVIEQIKAKKKSLRNKSKSQANGKENEDVSNNGKDFCEDEKPAQTEIANNDIDSNKIEHENDIENAKKTNGNDIENSNVNKEVSQQEVADKENAGLISICEIPEEKIINESEKDFMENNISDNYNNSKVFTAVNIEEGCKQECNSLEKSETESSAKKNISVSHDPLPESDIAHENSEDTHNESNNDILNGNTNSLAKCQEEVEECSEIKESSQVSVNGSDVSSQYEEANATDSIPEFPDTATKDDISVTTKITTFLGKWGYSQEQKQDSEVSSSKKIEETSFSHPYLSKVSGRRGIKDRLNSSATVFTSKELEAKTPENSGISLNDSFRVRTNPPRLNSLDLEENSTLRKFKGKRCLNASGEPEEEDELYHNSMKRRKLDEQAQESGLLGGLLWSPFKKKSYDDENQLKLSSTAESKLSRLLSPFWFWKKRAAGQKGK